MRCTAVSAWSADGADELGPGRRDLDQAGDNIPIGQVVHRPDGLVVIDHAEHSAVLLAAVVDDLSGELVKRAPEERAAITIGQLQRPRQVPGPERILT